MAIKSHLKVRSRQLERLTGKKYFETLWKKHSYLWEKLLSDQNMDSSLKCKWHILPAVIRRVSKGSMQQQQPNTRSQGTRRERRWQRWCSVLSNAVFFFVRRPAPGAWWGGRGRVKPIWIYWVITSVYMGGVYLCMSEVGTHVSEQTWANSKTVVDNVTPASLVPPGAFVGAQKHADTQNVCATTLKVWYWSKHQTTLQSRTQSE